MASYRYLALSLFITLFAPVACRVSPLALPVGLSLVSYNDTDYRSLWPYVNIEVGTPPQSLKMLLDINDGDIVVVNQTTFPCQSSAYAGVVCGWGAYSEDSSTTFELQTGQNVTAGGYSSYPGAVAKDVVTVYGEIFQAMTLVVIRDSYPIFGIAGYPGLEATPSSYLNVPISLKENGATNIIGYSIYLPHNNATTSGRLVFGGVETAKFTGSLETIQISQSSDTPPLGGIVVTLSSMSLSSHGTQTSIEATQDLQVLLVPGYPGLALPPSAQQQLLSLLNLTDVYQEQAADGDDGLLVQHNAMENETTIDLQFSETSIKMPVWDMLVPYNATHSYLILKNNTNDPQQESYIGTAFFSNAYSVFDFTHNQLSIAPLRDAALSGDNIVAINDTGVAGLVGYQQSNKKSNSGLSTGAKAGIGVGAGFGAMLVIGTVLVFVLFFVQRRRRSQKTQQVGWSQQHTK